MHQLELRYWTLHQIPIPEHLVVMLRERILVLLDNVLRNIPSKIGLNRIQPPRRSLPIHVTAWNICKGSDSIFGDECVQLRGNNVRLIQIGSRSTFRTVLAFHPMISLRDFAELFGIVVLFG